MKKGSLKVGDRVRYVGSEVVAYDYDKVYTICSYDDELELYAVESELEETYLLGESVLEKVK